VSKYFYHGTDLDNLISILLTKEIKCRRILSEQNIKTSIKLHPSNPGYNGKNYISVCMPNIDSFSNNSAYKLFIKNSFCTIIDGNITATKTLDSSNQLVRTTYHDEYEQFKLNNEASEYRFSDLKDEWQVKYSIPLNKIIGIAIPFKRINNNIYNPKKIKLLINLAKENNLLILDSSDKIFSEDYDNNIIDENIDVRNCAVGDKFLNEVIENANERISNKDYERLINNLKSNRFFDNVKRKVKSFRRQDRN
jgi:hypothetical protein